MLQSVCHELTPEGRFFVVEQAQRSWVSSEMGYDATITVPGVRGWGGGRVSGSWPTNTHPIVSNVQHETGSEVMKVTHVLPEGACRLLLKRKK